jgi:hypothetical protein
MSKGISKLILEKYLALLAVNLADPQMLYKIFVQITA